MTNTETIWATSAVEPRRIKCEPLDSVESVRSTDVMSPATHKVNPHCLTTNTDSDKADGSATCDVSSATECINSANLHHAMRHLNLPNRSAPVSRKSSPQPCAGHHTKIARRQALAINTQTPTVHGQYRLMSPQTATLPSSRRGSVPCLGTPSRHVTWEQYRENLWKQGSQLFGNNTRADAFIRPMELRLQADSRLGDSGSTYMWSPTRHVQVRAVVRSRGHSPIGMSRNFDLAMLHSTIPEASPSPRTPSFDRGASLGALMARNNMQNSATIAPDAKDTASMASAAATVTPHCESPQSPGYYVFPIHTPYARACLPVLASFLMCDQVRVGDTIDLPVPHPRSWTETMAYVYTGEEELLSTQVKRNIWYLGGKV